MLAEGYDVVGYDIKDHRYGDLRYPGRLVLQDVASLHGAQFRNAALIVASPPCQEYSYMAMPWTLAKQRAAAIRADETGAELERLNRLFSACFRIQREACEASGRHIPLIVENVKGAQPWVGRARGNFGSFYLWGDVPMLPIAARKPVKGPGQDWSRHKKTGETSQHWNITAAQCAREDGKKINPDRKNAVEHQGGSWFGVAHGKLAAQLNPVNIPGGFKTTGAPHIRNGQPHTKRLTNPAEHDDGVKHRGSGRVWFDTGPASHNSKSNKRKVASAMIAKIPPTLSRHIAATFR